MGILECARELVHKQADVPEPIKAPVSKRRSALASMRGGTRPVAVVPKRLNDAARQVEPGGLFLAVC
jgi:hypothetical protein